MSVGSLVSAISAHAWSLLLIGHLSVAAADFRIARPDDSPGPTMLEIQRRVLIAYRQIGISPTVLSFPALRSAAYAKQDLVDAELLRVDVPARDNKYVRVDTPLIVFDVVAAGRRTLRAIEGRDSLRGLRVGILRGILALEDAAAACATLEQAPDYASLNRMLEEGRIDVALMLTSNYPQLIAQRREEWARARIEVLNPRLASYPAYHFLSPRHADLAARLARALHDAGLPLDTIHAPAGQ